MSCIVLEIGLGCDRSSTRKKIIPLAIYIFSLSFIIAQVKTYGVYLTFIPGFIFISVIAVFGLFFKMSPIDDTTFPMGGFLMSMSEIAFSSGANLMLFYLKNICTVISFPGCCTVITSSLKNEKMSAAKTHVLQGVQEFAKSPTASPKNPSSTELANEHLTEGEGTEEPSTARKLSGSNKKERRNTTDKIVGVSEEAENLDDTCIILTPVVPLVKSITTGETIALRFGGEALNNFCFRKLRVHRMMVIFLFWNIGPSSGKYSGLH